jgi:hypothetical protein
MSKDMDNRQTSDNEFVPTQEAGKLAVERARRIIRQNNEMISKLKEESNILAEETDTFAHAENFSHQDSYAFDLYKIKSSNGFSDFFKDIFGTN